MQNPKVQIERVEGFSHDGLRLVATATIFETPIKISQSKSAYTQITLHQVISGEKLEHYKEFILERVEEKVLHEAISSMKARTDSYLKPELIKNGKTISGKGKQKA